MPYNMNIVGWVPEKDLEIIESWAREVPKNGVVVEVGSFCGRSSVCWGLTCDPSVQIYCIDMFQKEIIAEHDIPSERVTRCNFPISGQTYRIYESFLENTKDIKNIKHNRVISPQGVNFQGGMIDVFFLDAHQHNPNHWDNITYFSKFVKPGGRICGHNYQRGSNNVADNVSRLEEVYKTKVVLSDGSMWSITTSETIDLSKIT